MIEDSSFNGNRKKKEEGRPAPDFFGSLGKGMLEKEDIKTLETSPGLTPLGFGVCVRDMVLNKVMRVMEFLLQSSQRTQGYSRIHPDYPHFIFLARLTKRRFLNER